MSKNSDDESRRDPKKGTSEIPLSKSPGKAESSVDEKMLGETNPSEPRSDPKDIPKDFGRYQIERELGRGGMGAVYLALDVQLDRKVALKIPFFRDDEGGAIDRFRREARAMATVQHANLCPVYDVGQFKHWHFLTMAFVDGQSLNEKMKHGPLPVFRAARLMRTVALALHRAHEAGIVHRDLKPANIMLDKHEEPIIMDFGLARRQSANEIELTHSQAILGSPAYMAPEQVEARHGDIGPATDVYAMGVILYQMVSGRRPYEGSVASVFGQILSKEPDPPSKWCSNLHAAIDAICLKAMAKSPSQRYRTAAEFADALSLYLENADDFSPTAEFVHSNEDDESSMKVKSGSASVVDASHVRRTRDAERRQVTVMICNCDAIDPDQSLASMDPEEQRDVVDVFQRKCEEAINRFGGTIVQSAGQEILVCFGYPTAFEDAPHRAIRAALKIMEDMKPLNEGLQKKKKSPLSAWIAIHTGLVVAGESSLGDTQVDALSIIGEARTVTSRLEALTEPEQIIISDTTHRLVKGFFVCESHGTQKIRGVSKPMELFQVIEESATHSRVDLIDPSNLTPLVGRDMELGIIKDRWEHAIEGMGQFVLLTGEAGLGKSRLVREIKGFVEKENPDSPPHIVEWRCSAYHTGSSLFPAIAFFERLLGISREDSPKDRLDKLFNHLKELKLGEPEQVAILASMLSIPPDERCAPIEVSPIRQKERTLELLAEWLNEYSSMRPLLFIVEDLHWVDPTTLEFIALYVEQGLHDHVLALLSFRPEFHVPWQSHSHLTQVALTRLTKRQIGEMIRLKTGVNDIPQEILAKLADRTDGVPLFVEEFTQMVQESGVLDAGKSTKEIALALAEIPVTLQDLLAARLDRLDSNPDVVQLGATFGREFNYELLHAASDLGDDELQAELAKLVEAELLFQKGRPPKSNYIFKHALIQDAAYNSLLKQRRQQFHRKIADTLKSDAGQTAQTQPELLAHHYTEAGELETALQFWLQAGQHAQQRSANSEAISHLTRGLEVIEALDESPQRDQLELGFQLTLAPVLMANRGWSAPEVGKAIERAQQLVTKIGTVEDQFFVMWGLWGWRIIRADMDICQGIANDIMQMVAKSPDSHDLLPEAYWVVGATAYYIGDFETGLDLLEKGIALIDDGKERAYSLKTGQRCSLMLRSHTALALWQLGFPDQALQRADEMIRLGKDMDHPFSFAMGLFFRRQVLEFCGLVDRARESIEEEFKICHENGFVFFEVHAVFGRGVLLLKQGKVADAQKEFEIGLEMLKATGGNLSMDHPYRNIAEGYILAGRLDDAKEWLDRGFDLVNNHNERGMESEFLRLQGALALAAGDEKNAEKSYQQAIQVAQKQQAKSWELRATISFTELLVRQGRQSDARQILESIYTFFTEGFDTNDLVKAKSLLDKLATQS